MMLSDNDDTAQDISANGRNDSPAANASNGNAGTILSVSASSEGHTSSAGLSGRAAFIVMALASITVGAIIFILALHIWVVEGKYERSMPIDWGLASCQDGPCFEEARILTLESEAQGLRTDRIRTAQLSRLFVFIVAEVAGFALLVMGSVLVFDRVIAREQENIVVHSWSARSEFPGLLMCLIGAILVVWTVQSANRTTGFFEVFDRPVFLADPNWFRNELGLPSGSRPNPQPEARSAPPPSPELTPERMLGSRHFSTPEASSAPASSPTQEPEPSADGD